MIVQINEGVYLNTDTIVSIQLMLKNGISGGYYFVITSVGPVTHSTQYFKSEKEANKWLTDTFFDMSDIIDN